MSSVIEELLLKHYDRIIVLDGQDCNIQSRHLIFCIAHYSPSKEQYSDSRMIIHAYYPVAQKAYMASREIEKKAGPLGVDLRANHHLRIKSILSRLSGMSVGRNTLSYTKDAGSRFHVQVFESNEAMCNTDTVLPENHPLSCGNCTRCMDICPTGAIGKETFYPEKCLRFWMLNGICPPADIIREMRNRLIGCDLCQRCCPHNEDTFGPETTVSLDELFDPSAHGALRPLIGSNYATRNKILVQGCVMAASLKRHDLFETIHSLSENTGSEELKNTALTAMGMLR